MNRSLARTQAWELPGRQARTASENERNPALPIEDHFFDPEAEPSAGPPRTRASHARTAVRASPRAATGATATTARRACAPSTSTSIPATGPRPAVACCAPNASSTAAARAGAGPPMRRLRLRPSQPDRRRPSAGRRHRRDHRADARSRVAPTCRCPRDHPRGQRSHINHRFDNYSDPQVPRRMRPRPHYEFNLVSASLTQFVLFCGRPDTTDGRQRAD